MQNIEQTVINVMLEHGLTPPDRIFIDGGLHRFKDESGKPNNYYVAHADGRAAGVVGSWKTGLKVNWKADGDYPKLTDQQRIDFKIEQHRQQLIRKAEAKTRHDAAMTKASYIWARTTPPNNHPYLIKKRVKPHNAGEYKGFLVIPVFNSHKLVSVQLIDKDGGKRFLSGSQLKGSYSQLGSQKDNNPIMIVEGWATGASIYETTNYLTYVAFSAGKLKEVAQYVRSFNLTAPIVICGDNDLSGVGQAAAIDAALAVGGKYIIPPIVGADWNDVINMEVMP